ncbi:unnamed protein product [Pleuronectes platessa]|uniref:Uncharacterized protein n=1 Tax=Pleuronectes platessa TaxID=8262 RepID=A0A9N7UM91_PLEPL|nr:unnamed protein product [Pleuronectes platessa]
MDSTASPQGVCVQACSRRARSRASGIAPSYGIMQTPPEAETGVADEDKKKKIHKSVVVSKPACGCLPPEKCRLCIFFSEPEKIPVDISPLCLLPTGDFTAIEVVTFQTPPPPPPLPPARLKGFPGSGFHLLGTGTSWCLPLQSFHPYLFGHGLRGRTRKTTRHSEEETQHRHDNNNSADWQRGKGSFAGHM